ncbi:MAG: hypothetical protein ACFFDN_38345 [Candidatus Hodarchaeota archaeon]
MYLLNPTGIPYGKYLLEEGCPCICSEGSQSADAEGLEYSTCGGQCDCAHLAWETNYGANMDKA